LPGFLIFANDSQLPEVFTSANGIFIAGFGWSLIIFRLAKTIA
jgi:hypothetical protein